MPSDEVMTDFLELATGKELLLHADTNRITAVRANKTVVEIDGDAIDELVKRKWIAVDDDRKEVAITEKGGYWLDRWRAHKESELRRQRRLPVRAHSRRR